MGEMGSNVRPAPTESAPAQCRDRGSRLSRRGRHFRARLLWRVLAPVAVSVLTPTSVAFGNSVTAPVADAEVRSDAPGTNNGAGTKLYTDASPVRTSYLRFSIVPDGTITKATLRIHALSAQTTGFDVRGVASDTWQESTITYQNRPAAGAVAGSSGPVAANTWEAVDVTSLVPSSGPVSFALTTPSTTNLSLVSREGGAALAPQLVLETTTVGATPPASTAAPSIAGTPQVGLTLTADPGTWTGTAPIAYDYEWYRCDAAGLNCVAIPNASAQTYTLVAADQGSTIMVVVTASNSAGRVPAGSSVTGPVAAPGPGAQTVTVTPVADAYVDASAAATNTGSATKLRVDGTPVVVGYLRFSVPALSGTVSRATLSVNAASGQATGFEVHDVANDTWGEGTITYANRPAFGAGVAGSSGPLTAGRRASADVTSLISGAGVHSLALTTPSSTAASLESREAANKPQLVVEASGGGSPPVAPVNTVAPGISGLAQVSRTLTADPGVWTGTAPIDFGYQWESCTAAGLACGPIGGATSQSYALGAADEGSTLRVVVTASNAAGMRTATSGVTDTVAGPPSGADPAIAAAGDIACDPADPLFNGGIGTSDSCHQMQVSDLMVGAGLAAVLPLGDNQYECGGLAAINSSFATSWGRLKNISHPVIGNHDYTAPSGTDCDPNANGFGHWAYWGTAAGDPSKGYYSYDVGSWHLIALNSQCNKVAGGGCAAGSAQEQWLRADLASHPSSCALAYMHHPRWSSAEKQSDAGLDALWRALVQGDAEVLLVGHAHQYQRFAPMNAAGGADANGVREFVVGTGGKHIHSGDIWSEPNIQLVDDKTFGVLQLTLHAASYDWRFVPEAGKTFTDAGSQQCH